MQKISFPYRATPSSTRQLQARPKAARHFDDWVRSVSAGTLLLVALACSGLMLPAQALSDQLSAASRGIEVIDPDKAASELNHHIAGFALIAIGVMVVCGQKYKRFKFLQGLWPILFIGAGFFLAAWSDDEIWPRGDQSWVWLIGHDAEARQHKIYAVLLITIGLVEHLRARARLSRRWGTWLFPCLAVFGGVFLFFHDHGGHNAVTFPLMRVARVDAHGGLMHRAATHSRESTSPESSMRMEMHEHGQALHTRADRLEVPGDHESHQWQASGPGQTDVHDHVMTGAMLRIQRQHIWFAVLGFCIAIFKYLADARSFGKHFTCYPWACCLIALGISLLLYVE